MDLREAGDGFGPIRRLFTAPLNRAAEEKPPEPAGNGAPARTGYV